MFSLIIAVVAIALIVATVAATMYHSSSAEKGKDEAQAVGLHAQAQQIAAADIFYREEHGVGPASLADLAPTYLKAVPEGWTSVDGYIVSTKDNVISDAACETYNSKIGVTGVPSCADAAYADKAVCCSAAP